MKLPGFEGGGAVQSAAQSARATGREAVRVLGGMGKAISEGMEAYQAELAKTEAMKAEAQLSSSLDSIKAGITSREYVTAREAREALGGEGLATLSPEARKMLESRKDDDQIPTFMVGGALYEDAAAKAVESAANSLTIAPEMRERFRLQAGASVQRNKSALNAHHADEMHRYAVGAQVSALDEMLNSAASANDFARVRAFVDASGVLDPALKTKMRDEISKAQDVRPIHDALRLDSLPMLQRQLAEVNTLDLKKSLSPSERRTMAASLEQRIKDLRGAAPKPIDEKDVLSSNADRVWKSLTGTYSKVAMGSGGWTASEALSIKKALIPVSSGPVGDEEWRKMHAFVDAHTLQPSGKPKATKDAAAEGLRLKLYDDLNKFAQANPGAFKDDRIPFGPDGKEVPLYSLIPSLKAEHFTKFSDLQRTLREGGTTGPKFQAFVTENTIVDGIAQHYGIDPADKDNAPKIRKLREVAQLAIQRASPDGNLPFAELQKHAEAAVAAQVKTDPKWWSSKPGYSTPLLDLNIPSHVADGFAGVVGSKRMTMDAAVKAAPLFAADEASISTALDAAGVKHADTAGAIDLWGWTQANRKALDDRLRAKGVLSGDESRDAVLRYVLALELRAKAP